MHREIIIEKVNRFLVAEFEIDPENIDLGVVIESNFGFKVKHEDFATMETFQSLYDYVILHVGEKVEP
jgi:acyl carrier protein